MQSKRRQFDRMLEDHMSLWVNNETNRMYIKQHETWQRIPRIYHPAHNVYCDDATDPSCLVLSTEKEWWYDNDTGVWWYASTTDDLRIASSSGIPASTTQSDTWTSPEHVQYTAVLYNVVRHYRRHCGREDVPACIKLEVVREPGPSFEHPTSLTEHNGAWVPHRQIYFGVPSQAPPRADEEPHDRRCTKCFWYLSSVSIGDLEASCNIETRHKDKTRKVAFGPLHLDTILGLHQGYCIDDIWIAPSDRETPPTYHQFQYKLTDWTGVDF
jgi:hypothetical protein